MRIMVTGGAGFIGSAVVRHLVHVEGADVLNIDCLTYASSLTALNSVADSTRYAFRKIDIRDADDVSAAMNQFEPDAIVHLAAETHVDRSITGPATFIETNVTGTYNLLDAARRYCDKLSAPRRAAFRFLHISTDEVYGSLGAEGLFSEDTAYDPSSPYSASKAASDHLVMAWHRTYGLPALISNCSNNYGPYQFPEKLIPLTILNAIEGKSLPVYGNGSNVRDWLYVDDHVKALMLILQRGRPGEKYNVGGRNERSNLSVVETICDTLDRLRPSGAPHRRLITFVQDRPGHDQRYAIDARRLQRDLDWTPDETFASGLEKTVQWYLANGSWWEPLRSKFGGQRLGLVPTHERKNVAADGGRS